VEGQNIEHFRSESPGSGEAVCRQVQDELKATPELLLDGVLLVDRSFVSAGLFETVAVDARIGTISATDGQAVKQVWASFVKLQF
jgi:hypothetical protein